MMERYHWLQRTGILLRFVSDRAAAEKNGWDYVELVMRFAGTRGAINANLLRRKGEAQ